MSKRMIGEIMIELGYIWAEHVVDARRRQSANPDKRLGECLRELGYADEEKIHTALTVQERGTL